MSRDRFKELKDTGYDASKEEAEFQDVALDSVAGKTTDSDFFKNDKIKETLALSNKQLASLVQIHEKVLVSINGQAYTKVLGQRDEIKNSINDSMASIKRDLSVMKDGSEERWLSRTQKVARLGRQQGLAKSFGDFVQKYQQANIDFNERNKQRLRRQYLIAKPDATDEEVEEAIGSDRVGNVFSDMVMKSSRTAEAKSVLKEVEERHQDILNTEKAILELAGLFQEISDMIYRQQDSLDTIETAVEDANVHIEIASQEIEKAIEIRKGSRKKQLILLFILILILIGLGLVIYVQVFK